MCLKPYSDCFCFDVQISQTSAITTTTLFKRSRKKKVKKKKNTKDCVSLVTDTVKDNITSFSQTLSNSYQSHGLFKSV